MHSASGSGAEGKQLDKSYPAGKILYLIWNIVVLYLNHTNNKIRHITFCYKSEETWRQHAAWQRVVWARQLIWKQTPTVKALRGLRVCLWFKGSEERQCIILLITVNGCHLVCRLCLPFMQNAKPAVSDLLVNTFPPQSFLCPSSSCPHEQIPSPTTHLDRPNWDDTISASLLLGSWLKCPLQ